MLGDWQEEMATGDQDIDAQHQELLRRIQALLRAVRSQSGSEEIPKLLWFLKGYVRKHFRMEEKLLLDYGFPCYLAHKTQHDVFVRQVQRLEFQHAREGASTAMVVNAVLTMCKWLHQHFEHMDKKMVEYLRRAKDGELP